MFGETLPTSLTGSMTMRPEIDGGIKRSLVGTRVLMRLAVLWLMVFCSGPVSTAFGGVQHLSMTPPDPAMQEKVRAALAKLKESPDDVSAVETLLAVEPNVVESVGTNESFSNGDPVLNSALTWSQTLQPAEVLTACLEKGSTEAVHWALRQIVWKKHNGGFDKESMERLQPGIRMALVKPPPATRAQAVRTLLICLPSEERKGFLKGLLKDQPDEVMAAAVQALANYQRQIDPEIEAIVTRWLTTSEDPLLLDTCCTYWWLVKSRSEPEVKEAEISAFERLAGHPDTTVRSSVTRAVAAVATPAQPRMIAILLRLSHDKDALVQSYATRSLRNADTPAVNARLHELFATDQPQELRAAATETLGIFGKANLPLLISAANADKDSFVRLRAIYALRVIGTPEAGEGLAAAASQDPDEQVRKEAQTQLDWFRKEHLAKR